MLEIIKKLLYLLFKPIISLNKYPVMYKGKKLIIVYFGVFAGLGCFLGLTLIIYYLKIFGITLSFLEKLYLLIIPFSVMVGSKLLYLVVFWRPLVKKPAKYLRRTAFYNQGGQIGAFVGIIIYTFITGINFFVMFDAKTRHCIN